GMMGALQQALGTIKSEGAEALRVGNDVQTQDALLNLGVMGEGVQGGSEVVAAKGDTLSSNVIDTQVQSAEMKQKAGAMSKMGEAIKDRTDAGQNQQASPQLKQAIKQVSDMIQQASNATSSSVETIKQQVDVSAQDKSELDGMMGALQQALGTIKSE